MFPPAQRSEKSSEAVIGTHCANHLEDKRPRIPVKGQLKFGPERAGSNGDR